MLDLKFRSIHSKIPTLLQNTVDRKKNGQAHSAWKGKIGSDS